jgi:SAM-dependent methyltransferase
VLPAPPSDELSRASQAIRDEYARRTPSAPTGAAMFESRLRHYEALLGGLGRLPLTDRWLLDVGCANGKWLDICCQRWGASEERCVGIDLRPDSIERWQAEHPESRIRLECVAAHELDFPPQSFDLIHQSMMFSSVCSAALRESIAARLWELLRPGGLILSFDFWINPFNRATIGMRRKELRRLFPQAHLRAGRTISLAAPLCRVLNKLGLSGLPVPLERLRILNTHDLVALEREPA